MDNPHDHQTWQQTLAMLALVSAPGGHTAGESTPSRRADNRRAANARKAARLEPPPPFCGCIKILERCSSTSVVLCWYDATAGRYGEQLWTMSVARHETVCALTGATIHRGDAVYRPSARGACPANADRSILAAAMETREPLDVIQHSDE